MYTISSVTAVPIVPRCYCTALIHASATLFCAFATISTRTIVHHPCEDTFCAPAFFTKLACIQIFVEIALLRLDDCFGTRTIFLMSNVVLECRCAAVLRPLRVNTSQKEEDFQKCATLAANSQKAPMCSLIQCPIAGIRYDTKKLTFFRVVSQTSELFYCWHTRMSRRKITVIPYDSTRV